MLLDKYYITWHLPSLPPRRLPFYTSELPLGGYPDIQISRCQGVQVSGIFQVYLILALRDTTKVSGTTRHSPATLFINSYLPIAQVESPSFLHIPSTHHERERRAQRAQCKSLCSECRKSRLPFFQSPSAVFSIFPSQLAVFPLRSNRGMVPLAPLFASSLPPHAHHPPGSRA